MEAKRRLKGQGRAKILVFIWAVIILSGSCLFAAEQEAAPVAGRYRVFSLKHISAEQGKKYLADAGIGTVSQLPGANVLLVTAQAEDLIKANAIVELVDAEEPFDIKVFPHSVNFPSNEQITTEVNDVSIGTFSSPPSGAAKAKAIIDVHNDTVIAIAPAEQLRKIVSAIDKFQSSESQPPQAAKSAEPNKTSAVETEKISVAETPVAVPTDTELERAAAEAEAELKRVTAPSEAAARADADGNEPLGKLISSIAETELVAEPNEPNSIAEPSVEKQAPNLPAIGISEVNKADEKPQAEPNLEPVSLVSAKQSEDGKVRSYEPTPIIDGNQMLELNLPETLNIIDLVDLVGKYLQLDYMYDAMQVQGEVALKLQGPIKVKDLYPLLESVLRFRGLVMTRRGNLVTIVPAEEAVGIDPLLQPEQGGVQLGDVIITRVFKLKHIDTASAQNLLASMKLGADVTPISETGTLIITEYAYRMARVEELLEMVDQPGEPREFKFRQLKYTMATTLAPKIKSLAEQLGAVSITIAAPATPAATPARPTRRGRRPTPTPTPTAQPADKETVYLDSDERTNRILMIGLEEQLTVVNDLIDSLDVEQQDLRTLRLYDIKYVGAEEVVKKLGELGIITGSGIGGGSRAPVATISAEGAVAGRPPRGVPQPTVAAADIEPLVEEPQVVVIESTNSLLVNATSEQHVQIAMIISYVDSVTLEQAIPYVIYGLENQDPESLAEVLQKFIQETIKDQEGKIQQTIKKTDEDIIIVPDKNTFSILVYASKKNQEWIGSLIKQLDRRRPQVLIDVSLVEIAQKDAFEYDLNLIANAKDAVTGNIAIKSATLPFATGSKMEGGFNSKSATDAFQGFFSDAKIQALLTAIDTKHYGRILAKPKILVNDNEEGKINTTETTYVGETTTTYPSQGTTGGVLNPIYTTTYKPYDAKIELIIKPHISEGNLLRLEVSMVREDFKNIVENKPPDYTKSNVTTIVTVPDGSTIILGGLTKLKQEKDTSKVPFLGDIPVVGALFRGINNTTNDTQLYVFVKANILRPDDTAGGLEQLKRISERNRAGFEEHERAFQTHQDIPGVDPEPIEPLRVLDSE
ncbi:MAG: secretin N-terminal domain-containing protein [Phycisphaerae bacterium]|jgi:type II secretory pathway component GspD/PulD (secretin)